MRITENEALNVMVQATEDLCGNISGQFSPADWEQILGEAKARVIRYQNESFDAAAAWQRVVREFHQERYWGFTPSYKPPRESAEKWNLGISFIGLAFLTMTVTIMTVVWLGQNYASSQSPAEGFLLYTVVFLAVGKFGYFLWRNRHHQD